MENKNEDQSELDKFSDYTLHDSSITFLATEELELTANAIAALLPSTEEQDGEARKRQGTVYWSLGINFPNAMALKLLQIYASSEPRFEETVREIAIRHLCRLLSDNREGKSPILAYIAICELSPLLISCLEDEELLQDTFMVLADVAHYMAYDIISCHNNTWLDIRDYITSNSETKFKKAVHLFNRIAVLRLKDEDFKIPLLENLIPPILKRLETSEMIDNDWSLSFLGAFCVAVHMVDTNHTDMVNYLEEQMMKSVKDLMNKRMDVGFVRRGLREMEMAVKEQLDWYSDLCYIYVMNLIERIESIDNITKESKKIVQRIHYTMSTCPGGPKRGKNLTKDKKFVRIPREEHAAKLVTRLCKLIESKEIRKGRSFYIYCWDYFQIGLADMIFEVHGCSSVDVPGTIHGPIFLLYCILAYFRQYHADLPSSILRKFKQLLISCLTRQESRESHVSILAGVVSLVAGEVLECDHNGWDELSVCIASMADVDLRKALIVTRDLPPVYENFLIIVSQRMYPEILKLLDKEHENSKLWSLALQTGFTMAIQLLDSTRSDLAWNILYAIVKSGNEILRKDKEEILQHGIEGLERVVKKTAQYQYDEDQHKFALRLASMIARMAGADKKTKMAARDIYRFLKEIDPCDVS